MLDVLLRADDGIQGGDEHYNPDWELRNLGTGHYKFSQNEEIRRKQMEELRAAHQTVTSIQFFTISTIHDIHSIDSFRTPRCRVD